MKISGCNSVHFSHQILIDVGASNPKGTLKVTALSDSGEVIFKDNSSNSYLNTTIKGFDGGQGFIDRIAKVIKRTHDKVMLEHRSGEFPLEGDDKKLSGVVVFVPGTTYSNGKGKDKIAFMPNLKDKQGNTLTNIDFEPYTKKLKTMPKSETGIDVNSKQFDLVVTKDLGGTGIGLAQLLAKKNMLKEGDYVMGVMTGGGFGSVDLKVKNNVVEIETSESSSYIAGNYNSYAQIADLLHSTIHSDDPVKTLCELKAFNNKAIKDKIQILGKLGRQGVNVKSHIGTFCTEINRPDLFPLLRSVGDARIVEMNRMCVSEKDTELLAKIRSMPEDFTEIESTTDGKIAFELNTKTFDKNTLKRARTVAVEEYANAISLISINKIDDCVNKVALLGPFAHGVNQYVKRHSADFDGAKDLPELIMRKIKTNIDPDHVDLPSTKMLMDLYNFEIICDKDLNFSDNTYAGNLFLNPKCKFIPNRGSWFSIPLNVLKKS